MAGQLTIDTLRAGSGVLATQNGMTGIAKAWVNFDGGNGNTAGTINSSFNVSSITVNSQGNYTVNMTTAMPNTNYVPTVTNVRATGVFGDLGYPADAQALTTSTFQIGTKGSTGTPVNSFKVYASVFSS
jgi:hypothetical protein